MKIKLLAGFIALCAIVNAQTNYVLNFNGTSNYVDLGNAVANNVRSIELWFKPTANISPSITDQSYIFVGRDDASQLHEYGLYIKGVEYPSAQRGQATFYISDNSNYYYALSNNTSWAAGTWYHICGVIDPVNGMKLYINGQLQTATSSYNIAIPSASEITSLGRWSSSTARYFPGRIDEVRFWNRAISQTEIQQKMCYWLTPANETGLIGYWKMNEGSGSTIFDATVNANNGVIIGATFVQDSICFSGYLGVNEHSSHMNISIYPNPTTGVFTIALGQVQDDKTEIKITNLIGEEINNSPMKNQDSKIEVDLSSLQNGIYFVNIKTNEGLFTKKIVVQH
jgi:hypothetical protein